MRQLPTEKYENGRSNNQTYELICPKCGRYTRHKVCESLGIDAHEVDFSEYDDYEISVCQGCGSVSFVHQSRFSGDMDWDPITGETFLIPTVNVYPPRLEGFNKIEQTVTFPPKLKQVYSETYTAIATESWIMAAVGMRTIIELICIDKLISGSNLEQKINKLQSQAFVSKDITDLLHGVRFLGNDAVHKIDIPKREELNSAWNLINNLLGSIYVVQTARGILPRQDSRRITVDKKTTGKKKN